MICLSKVAFMIFINGLGVHRGRCSSIWIEKMFVCRMEYRVLLKLRSNSEEMVRRIEIDKFRHVPAMAVHGVPNSEF
jgi:hypothetical protein